MLFLADSWHTPILSDHRMHKRWWATCCRAHYQTVVLQTWTSVLKFPTWNTAPRLGFLLLSDDFCEEQDPHISVWGQAVLFPCLLSTFIPTRLPCSSEQSGPGVNLIPCRLFISPGLGVWNYYSCCMSTGIIYGIMCYSVWVIMLEFGVFLGAKACLLLSLFLL